jgi:hypothetical protein
MSSIKKIFQIRESSGFRLLMSQSESVALRDVEEWVDENGSSKLKNAWRRVVNANHPADPDDPWNDHSEDGLDANGNVPALNYDLWVDRSFVDPLLQSIELARSSADPELAWTLPHLDRIVAKIHDVIDVL